jgi:hypothetical protein
MTGDLFDTICEVYNKVILRIVESMQDIGAPLESQEENTTSNQQGTSVKAPQRRQASIFKKGHDKKAFIKSIGAMVSLGCVENPVVFADYESDDNESIELAQKFSYVEDPAPKNPEKNKRTSSPT